MKHLNGKYLLAADGAAFGRRSRQGRDRADRGREFLARSAERDGDSMPGWLRLLAGLFNTEENPRRV